MKFGLRYLNMGRFTDANAAIEFLQAAEEAGFESAWTVEHTVMPDGYESAYPYSDDGKIAGGVSDFPIPDPIVWMTYVAARTERIKLGTGILILPQHNPIVVAKQLATFDVVAPGRFLLGIGVGWLAEEFAALNVPFDDRGLRTDEYVDVLRTLWTEDCPSFDGECFSFEKVFCRPKPPTGPLPIHVGGHSKAAARRAGRLGDGFFPARGYPKELIELARQTAVEHGRDPAALEISLSCPEDVNRLADYAGDGVTRVLVPVSPMPGMAEPIRRPEDVLAWRSIIDDHRDAA